MLSVLTHRAVISLCLNQAFFSITNFTSAMYGGLIAQNILPVEQQWLVTVPLSIILGVSLLFLWPMQWIIQKFGYRSTFVLASLFGIIGHLIVILALYHQDFWIMCLGFCFIGLYQSSASFYRIAVSVYLPKTQHQIAITCIGVFALFAALLTPNLVLYTKDYNVFVPYLGTWYVLLGFSLISFGVSCVIPVLKYTEPEHHNEQPRFSFLSQVRSFYKEKPFRMGCSTATSASILMDVMMVTTPLAMIGCGLSGGSISAVVQSHVVSMFLPSILIGFLSKWLLPSRMLLTAWFLMACCLGLAFFGQTTGIFMLFMMLIGSSWYLGFSGSTALFASEYSPSKRVAAQAICDIHVLFFASTCSLISGSILNIYSFKGIVVFGFIIFMILGSLFLWDYFKSDNVS